MNIRILHGVLCAAVALSSMGNCLAAGNKPGTIAELALYRGADRRQILEEGAKKEGALTFYTSANVESVRATVAAFQKKYPFIKVDMWRASAAPLLSRLTEEFKAGHPIMDVIESTQGTTVVLQKVGIIQPFISPQFAQMEDEAMVDAPGGAAFAVAFRVSGVGFGYNTKLISTDQLPKTYRDLLDPKWKGKLGISGSDAGVNWMNAIYRNHGKDLLKQIADQGFPVYPLAGAALLDLIVSGEVPASPTIYDTVTYQMKQKGAPLGWVPLEPVRVNLGQVAIAKNAPHPHAALLFTDFEISRENAEIMRRAGYGNFRKDFPPLEKPYKKYYGEDTTEAIASDNDLFQKLFLKK